MHAPSAHPGSIFAEMVDVADKPITDRHAQAEAIVAASPALLARLKSGDLPKGDALRFACLAGVAAVKATPTLLPLCHPLGVHHARVEAELLPDAVRFVCRVRAKAATGVEMEALTAATAAALCLIDMGKGIDRDAHIRRAQVTGKSGGRSGTYTRDAHAGGHGQS